MLTVTKPERACNSHQGVNISNDVNDDCNPLTILVMGATIEIGKCTSVMSLLESEVGP